MHRIGPSWRGRWCWPRTGLATAHPRPARGLRAGARGRHPGQGLARAGGWPARRGHGTRQSAIKRSRRHGLCDTGTLQSPRSDAAVRWSADQGWCEAGGAMQWTTRIHWSTAAARALRAAGVQVVSRIARRRGHRTQCRIHQTHAAGSAAGAGETGHEPRWPHGTERRSQQMDHRGGRAPGRAALARPQLRHTDRYRHGAGR